MGMSMTRKKTFATLELSPIAVEPREGVGGHSGAVKERGGGIGLYKGILRAVEGLSTCSYTSETFSELQGRVQAAIDRLNLEGYANLGHWVTELDRRIEGMFLQRLTHIIQVWCAEFDRVEILDEIFYLLGMLRVHTVRGGGISG
ncbi:uncharacterized protein LACBIDRAFT_315243 [Laccaria bicolor S238N-H82]|uniref:Predicted protein n=1 Tax=Laccaria bicolor (strain S238N-H82 / ATCC MYA-4686) TaxID=486041 RepID=B0E057_LACBS|nr:uncharacterized protein LACBIDRAFT_315243 [Laccaria bicolor S238N-H82]EDQ99729.1 predicted protein [Laccaria bicolor S238N-H82]|eukprot:XP_001889565.1 predicted protein [Laccaria bicolor S238N-H82]